MKIQEFYKNNVKNLNLNLKNFYFISVNFSRTRYLSFFIGHTNTEKIFEEFYNKIIPQKKGVKYAFLQFDWIYIFFDKKNYSYEEVKEEISNIIKSYEDMIDLLYKKYNLEQEIKKEKYSFKRYEIPLIQIIVNEETNELFIEENSKLAQIYLMEEKIQENNKNNQLFKNMFFDKYDKLYYTLRNIKKQNFIFNFIEDKYTKLNF